MIENRPSNSPSKLWSSRFGRVCAIVSAALLVGVVAAATTGVASAQAVIEVDDLTERNAAKVALLQTEDPVDENSDSTGDTTLERFEQCLADAGAELEELDDQGDLDGAAIEEAFERCDPILDDFEFRFDFDDDPDFDFDGGSEFRFDFDDDPDFDFDDDFEFRFDFDDDPDFDFDDDFEFRFDFDDDPDFDFDGGSEFSLDFDEGQFKFDFGDDVGFAIDLGLSAEDEAVFERYEACLEDAGITFDGSLDDLDDLDERDFDELDEAFDNCEPILDELSADIHDFFADCPEDEDDE